MPRALRVEFSNTALLFLCVLGEMGRVWMLRILAPGELCITLVFLRLVEQQRAKTVACAKPTDGDATAIEFDLRAYAEEEVVAPCDAPGFFQENYHKFLSKVS